MGCNQKIRGALLLLASLKAVLLTSYPENILHSSECGLLKDWIQWLAKVFTGLELFYLVVKSQSQTSTCSGRKRIFFIFFCQQLKCNESIFEIKPGITVLLYTSRPNCIAFSIVFRFRFWLSHSNIKMCFNQNHRSVPLALCLLVMYWSWIKCLLELTLWSERSELAFAWEQERFLFCSSVPANWSTSWCGGWCLFWAGGGHAEGINTDGTTNKENQEGVRPMGKKKQRYRTKQKLSVSRKCSIMWMCFNYSDTVFQNSVECVKLKYIEQALQITCTGTFELWSIHLAYN